MDEQTYFQKMDEVSQDAFLSYALSTSSEEVREALEIQND